MVAAISGIGLVLGALGLLQGFRPRGDRAVKRADWIDIAVAITVTSGFTFGVMLIVVGIANLLL